MTDRSRRFYDYDADEVTSDVNNQSVDTEQVSSDSADVGRIDATHVRGGDNASLGMQLTSTTPQLHPEFQGLLLTGYDPDIFHRDYFDDGEYRVTFSDENNSNTDLYRTPDIIDFSQYTKIADAIFSSGTDDIRVNDHVILPDGRFVVYTTTNNLPSTDVRVGTDLQNLTNLGEVTPRADNGAIIEGDTVHLYPEADDSGDMSNIVEHWTTPIDDLTNATQQATAIDVSSKSWKGGDAEIVNIGGSYLMFMDHKESRYNIALARSDDLYNWTFVSDNLTVSVDGGDFAIAKNNGMLYALSEQSENTTDTIGAWTIDLNGSTPRAWARSSGLRYKFQGDTDASLGTSSFGSGSKTLGQNGLTLNTGTTSGSNFAAWKKYGGPGSSGWSNNRTFAADLNLATLGKGMYVTTGAIGAGDKTTEHVGFGYNGTDLIGTVADGTTQNTVTLIAGRGTGPLSVRAEYYAGDHVDFFVNGRKQGELSANLPSPTSATHSERMWTAVVNNGSQTTDVTLAISRVKVGVAATGRL